MGIRTSGDSFRAALSVLANGDRINIDYKIDAYGSPIQLYRVYDVQQDVRVLGTSIQGPIVEDFDAPDGHRLATVDELLPNEEVSREQNQACTP